MKYKLKSVGYYISPPGGATSPYKIGKNKIVFELITKGAVYAPDAREKLCGKGWIFAHLPGDYTVSLVEGDSHYECTTMLFSTTENYTRKIWSRSFLWDNEDDAIRFAHEILYSFHHTNMNKSILGDFIWGQLRFRQENYKRQKERKIVPPRISAVITYIDEYYNEDLSVDELASHVQLSASHLYSRFKEYIGITPHQYIIRQRMRAARHLLVTGNMPIKSIADEVGYSNTESFCRLFKKFTGLTAAEYRNKYMIYKK